MSIIAYFFGGGHNTRGGTLSATRIVSGGGTQSASGYCPGRHYPLSGGTHFGGGQYPL